MNPLVNVERLPVQQICSLEIILTILDVGEVIVTQCFFLVIARLIESSGIDLFSFLELT